MTVDNLAINTMRVLSSEMVDKANSGHPGLPLGASPMAYTLWDKMLKHNPKNPKWFDRDRFILSAGHGSALLYSLLHLFQYGLTIDDLKNFRQLKSLTPGHPEYKHVVGVEATTGPLGQGLAMAVGMAMAEKHLGAIFNKEDIKIIDHYTYTIAGDGCMMEGITNEAASLAGTLGLDKFIVLYDSNNISIEGSTDIAFREDVRKRYEALGFNTWLVEDGNDPAAIQNAIEEAKADTSKPSFIEIKTQIGFGSENAGTSKVHGAPLGCEGTKILKKNLGWDYEQDFFVPQEVKDHLVKRVEELDKEEKAWEELLGQYKEKYPEDYEKLQRFINNEFDLEFLDQDEYYTFDKDLASRNSSGESLNRIAKHIENLFGGSADLSPSNISDIKGVDSFSAENPKGQNIHFGVREHAMAAIANGISLHGGLQPYVATFFVFSDYLKPALRLSAIMEQKVIYILTHDSIGVGEDGPTHQPIDQMSMLRAIPNVVNFRPADNTETAGAWAYAMKSQGSPITLELTRQTLPSLGSSKRDVSKGAYVLKDFGSKPEMILMGSGSEVKLCLDVAEKLYKEGKNLRVVSVPSMELFDAQDKEYKESVLPTQIRNRVSLEVYNDASWYKYVGLDGLVIGMETFGESGPADQVFDYFGFTSDRIVEKIKKNYK